MCRVRTVFDCNHLGELSGLCVGGDRVCELPCSMACTTNRRLVLERVTTHEGTREELKPESCVSDEDTSAPMASLRASSMCSPSDLEALTATVIFTASSDSLSFWSLASFSVSSPLGLSSGLAPLGCLM
jgi:hypothetical protein